MKIKQYKSLNLFIALSNTLPTRHASQALSVRDTLFGSDTAISRWWRSAFELKYIFCDRQPPATSSYSPNLHDLPCLALQ
jgi:hypothetical protein